MTSLMSVEPNCAQPSICFQSFGEGCAPRGLGGRSSACREPAKIDLAMTGSSCLSSPAKISSGTGIGSPFESSITATNTSPPSTTSAHRLAGVRRPAGLRSGSGTCGLATASCASLAAYRAENLDPLTYQCSQIGSIGNGLSATNPPAECGELTGGLPAGGSGGGILAYDPVATDGYTGVNSNPRNVFYITAKTL